MSDLKTAALEYHANPRPGKLSVELTKPTATARDLALAYSPGVAEPVREIAWLTNTPAKATWSQSFQTVRPSSVWATSARWRPSQ